MFQEAPHDTGDRNVLANAGKSRQQAADTAHQQLHLHSRLRRFVEQLDHLLVDQSVHLQDQVATAAVLLMLDFALDQVLEPARKVTGATSSLRYELLAE